ncbi:pilS cassette [Neisseria meningitidis]|nr:pilS cassette [Neisseria meningitidis]
MRNLKFVIPTNLHPVIPTKVGIQFFEFQSFPINCLSIECLDSRLRGNDGGKILFFPIIAHNLKFLHSLKNKIRTLNPIIPIYVNIKILKIIVD